MENLNYNSKSLFFYLVFTVQRYSWPLYYHNLTETSLVPKMQILLIKIAFTQFIFSIFKSFIYFSTIVDM